ncbi:TolC family protein [bacterium]
MNNKKLALLYCTGIWKNVYLDINLSDAGTTFAARMREFVLKSCKLLTCFIFFLCTSFAFTKTISIEEFIETSVQNDTTFEEILIDELSLKYEKNLNLPAKDFVLSIKDQLELNSNDQTGEVSLTKLFPYIGTNISADYKTSPSSLTASNSSEFTIAISQPIARNAFGKLTRIEDKILDKQIDIKKYQITEAYEDYMALVISTYYDWYAAYENLSIANSSYEQSLKLFENIQSREQSKIALPIDVNKSRIQLLTKKESLITLEEKYESFLNSIKQALRYSPTETLTPINPFDYNKQEIEFEKDYKSFQETSRTYKILNLLKQKSSLDINKYANDLLPSTNLLLSYNLEGDNYTIKNSESNTYIGFSFEWSFSSQVERAKYRISKIEHKKTNLSNENKKIQLETDLRNLYLQIKREKKLIEIAIEKIKLSESILKDETVNYSYGKVTLNDYIDAVNRLDENRFNLLLHSIRLKVLTTEWLRLTDKLVVETKK